MPIKDTRNCPWCHKVLKPKYQTYKNDTWKIVECSCGYKRGIRNA